MHKKKQRELTDFFSKEKRSQISVFIIIGVLLVIIVSFFLYLSLREKEISPEDKYAMLSDKAIIVRNYVDDCLGKEADNALEFVSLQGGFAYRPELGLKRDNYNIAYDYYLGVNLLPGFDEIEEDEISAYIEEYLPKCLDETGILEQEYITLGDISVETDIQEDFVKVDVNYPITLTVGPRQEILNDFSVKKDISLGMLIDVAHDIIDHVVEDPNWIDIGFLESLNLDIEVIHIDPYTIVYKINDPEVEFRGERYFFMFATLFTENSPPDLFTFSEYSVKLGETLEIEPYSIDFDGDSLTYSADSPLVDIDPVTGLIAFTPTSAREYNFKITVDDGNGLSDIEELKVRVI